MGNCFKCGISEEKAYLFDVISGKGIVKVCNKCFSGTGLPIVKKPSEIQIEESKKKPESIMPSFQITGKPNDFKKEELKNQNLVLKNLADKNFNSKVASGKNRGDLVHNFHWILMRARRMQKLTQKQLAEKIAESEAGIKMAEQGIIPESSLYLVEKLERFLKVKIQKEKKPELPEKKVSFNSITSKNLNISDLRRNLEKPIPYWRNKLFKKQESKITDLDYMYKNLSDEKLYEIKQEVEKIDLEKKDLSDEEINELMYGKKE